MEFFTSTLRSVQEAAEWLVGLFLQLTDVAFVAYRFLMHLAVQILRSLIELIASALCLLATYHALRWLEQQFLYSIDHPEQDRQVQGREEGEQQGEDQQDQQDEDQQGSHEQDQDQDQDRHHPVVHEPTLGDQLNSVEGVIPFPWNGVSSKKLQPHRSSRFQGFFNASHDDNEDGPPKPSTQERKIVWPPNHYTLKARKEREKGEQMLPGLISRAPARERRVYNERPEEFYYPNQQERATNTAKEPPHQWFQPQKRKLTPREEDELVYQQWHQACNAAFEDTSLELPVPPFWPDVVHLLSSGSDARQRKKDEKTRWHPDRLHFTQRRGGAPPWAGEMFVAMENANV